MVKQVKQLDRVTIRFAGDSGDGMQLTGDRFTQETASFGNDLSTLPNFPAEIRAPAGTLPGVSSFQVHFADHDILTPGDQPDVLVAMNPAALKANVGDLAKGAAVIVDTHDFTARNLAKAGYGHNPLEADDLDEYAVHPVDLTGMTVEAVKDFGLSRKDAARAKNMFALGLLSWMYGRPTETTTAFLERRFAKAAQVRDANIAAFRAGWNFGETTEAFVVQYEIKPAPMVPGTYRNITGNMALSYGLVAASVQSDLPLFLGSYPITPASDILHELSRHKRFGVTTFQAEDEIAGIGAALGASFSGALGVTTTSGPGVALKSETIGLAVMTELPLIVIDVQRGGPSTGLPTKTEQADLLQAMFGRNGEAPVPIVAPQSPADCFDAAVEAVRIAVTYRTPVMLLSDGYLANGSEPWHIPEVADLPRIDADFATEPNHVAPGTGKAAGKDTREFWPFLRDEETLARPWAIPGTPGLEHRIGGLEKGDGHGNISYDPANHDLMVRTRQAKVDRIADTLPPLEVDDPSGKARVLALGWGSTYGPIGAACRQVRGAGFDVAQAHLRHLNPFPADLGDLLRRYEAVLVPEMNLGQLSLLLRAEYLVDVVGYNQVRGLPLRAAELAEAITGLIESTTHPASNGATRGARQEVTS
ncbi:MAG: 2-oxoglutarate/2-oxoacid ferredoxin oxidoreductase, gamma subunit / 2-oxoglutarate/2-oxoacid ferredoxin oxidoreductase, alpha subunit [uncultured Nocardioidaceae bacterium]|uniref:2-oxoglutarate/2-oxoacid ferredoxin oxidoreductase, gamma subunit / 2-oxoglutarate/2-oxoacid ferredoxin oxidoreductase, alpha subunit n=1 Tax=uncultured Nocardioidaceae bacterium TaxID=253824 RepID=A0A6J4MAF0_9ACTN|nr:MAG: 2-oxoglutarate/2-oxoacid ferredoxin oxidoreductase, gamma subunit / 2-oxoglutarate/2-oxoacid ferredoxin oxidoreductase, alpha subunit [uncultured Nocardioidaceae bacterium]